MDTRGTSTAQLTVPATGAQTEVADKPGTAEPTGSCQSQANTAVTTDGFKNDGEATAQQGEDAAAATGDEVQLSESGDTAPGAQSESLGEVEERLRKEGEAQGKGEEMKEAAKGGDEW